MVCDRCGATNNETVLLCENCGFFLKKLEDISTAIPLSEQPSMGVGENKSAIEQASISDAESGRELQQSSTGADKERSELPIDELPTARVPSMANPSSFAPVSLLPFTTEFPLEAEQALIVQTPPGDDVTIAAAPSPLLHPGAGWFALPSRAKTDASSSLSGINASSVLPGTSTPPGMAALSIQPDLHQPFAQSEPNEPQEQGKQNRASSQSELNEQQEQASQSVTQSQPELNEHIVLRHQPVSYPQPDQHIQSAQGQQGASEDETRLLSQMGMYPMNTWSEAPTSSLQVGTSMPSSLAGMYAVSTQAEMYAPEQAGMYSAPGQPALPQPQAQYAGLGEQPPQAGDPWQSWQEDGNYPAPPLSERLGNVYPGSPGATAPNGSASQGSGLPAVGGINIFIQPLPRWVMVVGPLGGVALLAGLIFVNTDWATGAVAAALVAIILAILLGIVAGVRIALGLLQETNPRRRSQVISTALLILLLLLFSGVGISQQNNLHMAQGRYLESHQNWASAITQYQAAGEKSSASVDVARTYDEWGDAQNRQHQYADAVTQFSMVLQNYPDATSAFNMAKTDSITSYLGWADQSTRQQNYAAATAHYDTLLSLTFCATVCRALAQPKDATAYYHLAEQQLSQHQYVQAVNAYQALSTRFSTAPEASQIHAHYAQALWGKGQQEVNTTCVDALSTYRLLSRLFADTSQGKQAATALTQPVAVKGHFTQTIPGAPFHPTVYLVQGLVVGIQQDQLPSLLAGAPAVPIHSDGTFTFTSVPQGTYELIWSSDNTLHFYYAFSGQHVLYTAHPGPLCTYNYGDINQAIPTGAQ